MSTLIRSSSHLRSPKVVDLTMTQAEISSEQRGNPFPQILAILVGLTLFFVLATVPASIFGDHSPYLLTIDIVAYGIAGIVLGFFWPKLGWRLGLYLFAVWPPMLLFMLFLGGENLTNGPVNWKGILSDLIGYLMIGVAACVGAALGSAIKRRRLRGSSQPLLAGEDM